MKVNMKKHTLTACDRITGQCLGFIKSVSYTNQSFKLTQNACEAKIYSSYDRIYAEIDDLTFYSGGKLIFLIS